MSQLFPIITVPTDAAEATEAMGTKFKFWFHDPEFGYCLYKQARNNTGEDWAEKIASELCELLGLPHAKYELATWDGNCGTVSPSFVPVRGSLILGNEILACISETAIIFAQKILEINQSKLLFNTGRITFE